MPLIDERIVAPGDVFVAGDIGIKQGINLVDGDTITHITITVYNEEGEDVTSDIAGSGVFDSAKLHTTCALSGFIGGETYRVHHHIVTTRLREFNDYILIRCTDQ